MNRIATEKNWKNFLCDLSFTCLLPTLFSHSEDFDLPCCREHGTAQVQEEFKWLQRASHNDSSMPGVAATGLPLSWVPACFCLFIFRGEGEGTGWVYRHTCTQLLMSDITGSSPRIDLPSLSSLFLAQQALMKQKARAPLQDAPRAPQGSATPETGA